MIERIIRPGDMIDIGHVGDEKSIIILFPVEKIVNKLGAGGTWSVILQRAGEDEAYPCASVTTRDSGYTVEWTIEAEDAGIDGYGEAQLSYAVDDKTLYSQIYRTHTDRSLDASQETPDQWSTWITRFNSLAASAVANADLALSYKESAEEYKNTAASSAEAAAESELNASGSATASAESATAAAESAEAAYGSATSAAESAEESESYKNSAETAAINASGFASSAGTAAESAEASAASAAESLSELEEKIASGEFKGEKGDKGDKGDTGATGPQGPQGEKGTDGAITEDAPSDGSTYGRKNGAWAEVSEFTDTYKSEVDEMYADWSAMSASLTALEGVI